MRVAARRLRVPALALPRPSERFAPHLRAAQVILTGLFAGTAVANLVAAANGWLRPFHGFDFINYVDAARRWVETGTPYLAHEVAGPFAFSSDTFLHPPISLLLFTPFLVLPAFLYWLIPLAGTAAIIAAWRPALWTWPVIALLLNWPRFDGALIVGNSDLWIAFFLAAGLRYGWPVLLLVLKPSLAPFAIVELAALVRAEAVPIHRWAKIGVAAAVLAVTAAPFGSLWLDWFAVVRHSPADAFYSLGALPWLVVPAVAWWGRRRGRRRSDVDRNAISRLEDRRVTRERDVDRGRRRATDLG